MNRINYDAVVQTVQEDEHLDKIAPEKLIEGIEITKNYDYRISKWYYKIATVLLNLVALLVLPLVLQFKHSLIIKGRRNLRHLKGGAISISNHVLPLDGAIVAQSMFPKRVMFHSLEDNFRIPYIRHLIKMLGCIPIPNSLTARPAYIKATSEFLKEGKVIQIYPEASLWPYYNGIRKFKSGAFHFAAKNNVPIVPIAIHFRKPRGFEKWLPSKNSLVTVHIGKPIYPNNDLPFKESLEELLQKSHRNLVRMNRYFKLLDEQKVKQEEELEEEIM